MMVLGIDTALRRGGVALAGPDLEDGRDLGEAGRHAEGLLPAALELLARHRLAASDLAAVVVNVGPGSFTGIRIGVAAALGLGSSAGIAVGGVACLDVLARACVDRLRPPVGCTVAAVADIRRGEVVWAPYRVTPEGPVSEGEERRIAVDAPGPSPAGRLWIAGDGASILWPEREDAVQWVGGGLERAVAAARLGLEAVREGRLAAPVPRYARPADARPRRG